MNKRHTLDDLTEQDRRIKEMESYVSTLISQAKLAGYTWAQIGAALGMSAQGAQQRHKRSLPVRIAGEQVLFGHE